MFRSVKARDGWKRDHIYRSYHSDVARASHWPLLLEKDRNYSKEGAHTMTLHDTKKFDNDLRGRADEDLTFSTPLSVDNVILQRVRSNE
jgi:hypothetical protein